MAYLWGWRHAGERRHVRPYENRPVDILGGGYVVAPPSISTKGSYEIIEGTLDDLANLTDPRRAGWPDCTTFPDQGGRKK